jgi:hypothetical protein
MGKVTEIIALAFDFDDTLVPDSTTKLLQKHGINTDSFWKVQAKELIDQGYDPPLAYLKLILDNVGAGKPLALDSDFHPGIPEFFDDIRDLVRKSSGIEVEFYIISGGLQPVVEGSAIVRKHFNGVYGCQLAGDTDDGVLKYVKRCITFTEKTRYLFEINKGIDQNESRTKPHLVNKYVDDRDRKIPFSNMIYVGDGLTDIPCFSLIQKSKGKAFGVFDPSSQSKAKAALEEFLQPNRVTSMHSPRYGPDDDLGSLLRASVSSLCLEIQVQRGSPKRS